jgi:hypothetical protein
MKKEGSKSNTTGHYYIIQIPIRKEGNFTVFPHLTGLLPQKETLDQIPDPKKNKASNVLTTSYILSCHLE